MSSPREISVRVPQILDALERGETFIVTRDGAPVGELIPLRRHRGATREQFAAGSASAPVIDAARFRTDVERAVTGD